jgi:hypothetical protein
MFRNRNLFLKLGGVGTAGLVLYQVFNSLKVKTPKQSDTNIDPNDLTNQIIKPNERLISVQLITRHGARTPIHLISGLEEVC